MFYRVADQRELHHEAGSADQFAEGRDRAHGRRAERLRGRTAAITPHDGKAEFCGAGGVPAVGRNETDPFARNAKRSTAR